MKKILVFLAKVTDLVSTIALTVGTILLVLKLIGVEPYKIFVCFGIAIASFLISCLLRSEPITVPEKILKKVGGTCFSISAFLFLIINTDLLTIFGTLTQKLKFNQFLYAIVGVVIFMAYYIIKNAKEGINKILSCLCKVLSELLFKYVGILFVLLAIFNKNAWLSLLLFFALAVITVFLEYWYVSDEEQTEKNVIITEILGKITKVTVYVALITGFLLLLNIVSPIKAAIFIGIALITVFLPSFLNNDGKEMEKAA